MAQISDIPYLAGPRLAVPAHLVNKDPSKLGEAVQSILSKQIYSQEVGETVSEMTPKYYNDLMNAVEEGQKAGFQSPFYVVVIRKKETIGGQVSNVLFHRFVTRQTKPLPDVLRRDYPNADHDVFEIDGRACNISLLWTLPTAQDAATIIKNQDLYDPQLVKWIQDFNQGILS